MHYLKDLRKDLHNLTHPYFKGIGFKYQAKKPACYIHESERNATIKLYFDFKTLTYNHEFFPIRVSFPEVEKIINKIGEPNFEMKHLTEYQDTIHHNFTPEFEHSYRELDLTTPEAFIQWGEMIVKYMKEEGGYEFIEKFSYLPNVLEEMNRLDKKKILWKEFIMAGSPIWFFRGLVIAKLCNDLNYDSRVIWVNQFFYEEKYNLKEWIPKYDLLKEELSSTKPTYNIDKNKS